MINTALQGGDRSLLELPWEKLLYLVLIKGYRGALGTQVSPNPNFVNIHGTATHFLLGYHRIIGLFELEV